MFKVKHGLDRIEKITTYFWLANIEQVYNSSRIIQVGIYKTILHSRYYKQETFKLACPNTTLHTYPYTHTNRNAAAIIAALQITNDLRNRHHCRIWLSAHPTVCSGPVWC